MRPVGPTISCWGLHAPRCRPAVIAQAAAAEAEETSVKAAAAQARPSRRHVKPLKENDWAQLKQAIHEDNTVLQPSSSSDGLMVEKLVNCLIEDAEMRKKMPKVLDDKAARRYPPVRLLAITPAEQLQCMSALAAASKQAALALNQRQPPPPAAAADASTAEDASTSSSSGNSGDANSSTTSSSSSEKPKPTRFSTARVAWHPVPVTSAMSAVVGVPTGSILYYTTPALIAPPLWFHLSRKQRMPFEVRPNSNPKVQAKRVKALQQQIVEHLDTSGQEWVLVRCQGVEGLVVLNKIVAWLRRSLKGRDWWEGGDMAAVLLNSFEEPIKTQLQSSSSSRVGRSGGSRVQRPAAAAVTAAEGQQQQQEQQQQTRTIYVVALMRCTPKQPWALDVLVPDTRDPKQLTQQQAAEQQ